MFLGTPAWRLCLHIPVGQARQERPPCPWTRYPGIRIADRILGNPDGGRRVTATFKTSGSPRLRCFRPLTGHRGKEDLAAGFDTVRGPFVPQVHPAL